MWRWRSHLAKLFVIKLVFRLHLVKRNTNSITNNNYKDLWLYATKKFFFTLKLLLKLQ